MEENGHSSHWQLGSKHGPPPNPKNLLLKHIIALLKLKVFSHFNANIYVFKMVKIPSFPTAHHWFGPLLYIHRVAKCPF